MCLGAVRSCQRPAIARRCRVRSCRLWEFVRVFSGCSGARVRTCAVAIRSFRFGAKAGAWVRLDKFPSGLYRRAPMNDGRRCREREQRTHWHWIVHPGQKALDSLMRRRRCQGRDRRRTAGIRHSAAGRWHNRGHGRQRNTLAGRGRHMTSGCAGSQSHAVGLAPNGECEEALIALDVLRTLSGARTMRRKVGLVWGPQNSSEVATGR